MIKLTDLIKEELDINSKLEQGGFDIIEDDEVLSIINNIIPLLGSNITSNALNSLVMVVEESLGEEIEY